MLRQLRNNDIIFATIFVCFSQISPALSNNCDNNRLDSAQIWPPSRGPRTRTSFLLFFSPPWRANSDLRLEYGGIFFKNPQDVRKYEQDFLVLPDLLKNKSAYRLPRGRIVRLLEKFEYYSGRACDGEHGFGYVIITRPI